MEKQFSVLFDMDGVLINTEVEYDKFWVHLSQFYKPNVENLIEAIKGKTLREIVSTYFCHLTEEDQENVVKMTTEFETKMPFELIPGVLSFVNELKATGIKIGLVTSSNRLKLKAVNETHHFDKVFGGLVCSEDIPRGKPDPACYLLGAEKIGAEPKNCVVFEDSFAGIEAATIAGMKVIALSTTHPIDQLREKVDVIIPNFLNFTLDDLKAILEVQ